MIGALTRYWVTKGLSFSSCCVCILLLGFAPPLFGEPEVDSLTEDQSTGSAEVWPEKLSGKDTWEKVVSFPGTLIYFPLGLIFGAQKATIRFVSEKRVIPRVEDVLTSDDERRGLRPTYAARTGGGVGVFIFQALQSYGVTKTP